MDHVEIRYGGNGSNGMIRVAGSNLTLTNSIVRNSSSYGVFVSEGTADLESDLIVGSSWAGIRAESNSVVDAVNNTIDGNQRGVDVDNSTVQSHQQSDYVQHLDRRPRRGVVEGLAGLQRRLQSERDELRRRHQSHAESTAICR